MITTEVGENLTAAQQRERNLRDEKALGILLTSVADDIVHHLDQASNAKNAWDILERTFGAKGKQSKISLKMQLYSLSMHENENLSSVVNRLKSICTQLSHIECNIDEDDKIAIILKSLPMQYENIVTVLKEKEPIPSLESIIHSLQEEENKHNHTQATNEVPGSQALFISTTSKPYKPCKHCGKTNHVSLNCYKIKKCVKCGRVGHAPQFCPNGGGGGGTSRKGGNTGGSGGGGGSSFKGRHVHYTQDEDSDDGDHNGDDDGTKLDEEIHFISAPSSPRASTSSRTSFANKVHAKISPKIGKKMYYSSSGDDIL